MSFISALLNCVPASCCWSLDLYFVFGCAVGVAWFTYYCVTSSCLTYSCFTSSCSSRLTSSCATSSSCLTHSCFTSPCLTSCYASCFTSSFLTSKGALPLPDGVLEAPISSSCFTSSCFYLLCNLFFLDFERGVAPCRWGAGSTHIFFLFRIILFYFNSIVHYVSSVCIAFSVWLTTFSAMLSIMCLILFNMSSSLLWIVL